MSGNDLPEFVGRVLRAANTPPPAKVTMTNSAATGDGISLRHLRGPIAAEQRARIVALLRAMADAYEQRAEQRADDPRLPHDWMPMYHRGQADALLIAANRIEAGDGS